jgi:histidine triad (HIT) family protein
MPSHQPASYDCPFCQIARSTANSSDVTVRTDIVLHDQFVTAFISLHWWPNNPGHALVIPNDHYVNIYEIRCGSGYCPRPDLSYSGNNNEY